MAGKNPYEAFDNFRGPLQRALSCINSEAHLWAVRSNGYRPGQQHALVPDVGEPVRLARDADLYLTSLFIYSLVEVEGERGPWKVKTDAYYHSLLNGDYSEIVSYHWHPDQDGDPAPPHLHIGVGIGASLGEVHKYHIPTGRVALEDVLRLAISEFGASPQREDWREVLDKSKKAFENWSTWSGSSS